MTEGMDAESVAPTQDIVDNDSGLNMPLGLLTSLDVLNAMSIKEVEIKKIEDKLSIRQLDATSSSFINIILDGNADNIERLCMNVVTFKPLLKRAASKDNLVISTSPAEIMLKAGRTKAKVRQITQEYYRTRGPPVPTEGWLKSPFSDFIEAVESCSDCGNTIRMRLVKDKGLLIASQDSENTYVSALLNPATLSDDRSFFSTPLLLPMLSIFKKKKDVTEIEILVTMNAALMLRFNSDNMSIFYVLAPIDLKGTDSKELPNTVTEEELGLF